MTEDTLIKVPMVSTVITNSEVHPESVDIQYFVGDTIIMTAEIQRDIVCDAEGAFDPITLTQLMVTPHEHLDCLDRVLVQHEKGETSGPEWEELISRISNLLRPPVDA